MLDFLSGQDANVPVRYGDEKQPYVNVSSVTYTVRDHTGLAIPALTNVALNPGPTDFQSIITIPAMYNTIGVGKYFERRTITVTFTYNTRVYTKTVQYRVVPFVPMLVTPESVRDFIGINRNELEDDDIDIFAAYVTTATDFTKAVLDAALVTGTMLEVYANDCIRMQAVLDVLPSLKNRVAQAEKNGIMGFDRPKIEDFSDIERAALDRYWRGRLLLLDLEDVGADVTLIVVTQDPDPVTGG